jgi:hypothetical protein
MIQIVRSGPDWLGSEQKMCQRLVGPVHAVARSIMSAHSFFFANLNQILTTREIFINFK